MPVQTATATETGKVIYTMGVSVVQSVKASF